MSKNGNSLRQAIITAGTAIVALGVTSNSDALGWSSYESTQFRKFVEGVEFLGIAEIESGFEFEGTIVGGLSGIVFDPVTSNFLAVSDDRGAGSDGTPRFYELAIDLSDGALDSGDVSFLSVTALSQDGLTLDEINPDPEGIAIDAGGNLFISSERNLDGRFPQIFEVSPDGMVVGELPVDDKFKGTDDFQGVRNNLGFESLTITPDKRTLYTATESALVQDGDPSSVETGSAARIVKYDLETGMPVAEFVYEVDPIANEPSPPDAFADSGLVELIAIDNQGTLLALERSFSIGAPGRGYTGRLYLARTQGATNVIDQASIPTSIEEGELEINVDELVQKELLADLGDFGIVVDNIEGLAFGPVLPDGRPTLIIASDDNFSAFGPQANQFVALALDIRTIPTITSDKETPDEIRFDGPFDLTEGPDPDDPAIWIHPRNTLRSTVITSMKNGGLRVYDLTGNELQRIEPEGIRYNNVDVIYDAFRQMDLVIASDRANDTLAIFRIRNNGTLVDVTSNSIPETIFGVDDGERTAYGLATYVSPADDENYVFVTQGDGAKIAQLRLQRRRGKVTFEKVRELMLPVPDGEDPEDFQSEGIAIDRETGIGYVTVEEELGLLAFDAEVDGSDRFEVVAPIDSEFFEPDLEGVSIYYGEDGEGLLVVSSQGDATFAVFDRATLEYLGSFAIRSKASIDGVEESDGLEIFSGALPGFPRGLLVTQDGSNEIEVVFGDPDDGEIQNFNVNFKYIDLAKVLELFGQQPNPCFDPRERGSGVFRRWICRFFDRH
ncbi:MAG: phytase [Myxococcota bacterium]